MVDKEEMGKELLAEHYKFYIIVSVFSSWKNEIILFQCISTYIYIFFSKAQLLHVIFKNQLLCKQYENVKCPVSIIQNYTFTLFTLFIFAIKIILRTTN